MRRIFLSGFVLLVFVLSGAVMAQDTVTLTVWHQFTDNNAEAWQTLKTNFEAANPGIVIEDTGYQADDLLQALTVALPAGEGPDLAYLDASTSYLGALVESNLAYDLTDIFAERGWDEQMFEWAQDKTSYEGRNYGVGGYAEIVGIYYRADLFEEFGLEAPTTWDALIAAADRGVAEGILPFNIGGLEGWPISHFCGVLIHSMVPVATIADIELLTGTTTYADTPEAVEAVDTCRQWTLETGYYPEDVIGISYYDSRDEFIAGNGLMRIDGSWAVPSLQESEFDIQFTPFPTQEGMAAQGEGGLSSTWVVNSATTNLDAALQLIDYVVFSDEANVTWVDAGLIPAVNFDMAMASASPLQQANVSGIEMVSTDGDGLGYWIGYVSDPSVSDAMVSAWGGLLTGQIDAEQWAALVSEATTAAREFRTVTE